MNEHSFSLRPLQLGFSLGTFLVIGYLACLALAIIVPDRGMHQAWLQLFAGFAWTPLGMLIGAVESFVYGLATGLVFAPIAKVRTLQTSKSLHARAGDASICQARLLTGQWPAQSYRAARCVLLGTVAVYWWQ